MKQFSTPIAILIVVLVGIFSYTAFQPSSNQPVTIMETTVPPIPTLNPAAVAEGETLYNQHCASCHGVNLEGKPNWKVPQADGSLLPPPHDSSGHTWHHPDPFLIEITINGGDPEQYNTKMPGFGDQLSEQEIVSIFDYIKAHWGREEREYQWWLTARDKTP